MSGVLRVGVALAVMLLATWAYGENHRTQQAFRAEERLEREIADARAALAVLRAEWAYLNRPERLRDLAALNDDRLRLVPLAAEAFAPLKDVPLSADLAARDEVLAEAGR